MHCDECPSRQSRELGDERRLFVILCVILCVSVCPHDKTKTAEITTKLGTWIVHHDTIRPYNEY